MALVGHISGSSQSNSVIGVSGSVIVANRPNSLFPSMPGTDVTFFVSGSNDNTATTVFGGKVVMSGALGATTINATTVSGSGNFDVGGDLRIAGDIRIDGNDIRSSTGDAAIQLIGSSVVIPGDLTVNGTTVTIDATNLEIEDALIGLGFTSGSDDVAAGDRGFIGGIDSADNVAMFWDNSASEFAVVKTDSTAGATSINITTYAQFHALGLTGSLTKLSDGSDYLRAGTNISLTTGSAGQVTVAVTGMATGDVVGPSSATDSAIALYDGITGKLIKNSSLKLGLGTSTQAYVTASVALTNYGLALSPNGTGSFSTKTPDGTSAGGNARGQYAVDLQLARNAATQVAAGNYSTVGGGQSNAASSNWSTVGGGNANNILGQYSSILGGDTNSISSRDYSSIGGGQTNSSSTGGTHHTIAGGQNNATGGTHASIGGGSANTAGGQYSTVVGGLSNTAQSYGEIVGGVYATQGAGSSSSYVSTDRLLVIGNGTGISARSNALTLIKNGDLHLSGTLTLMSGSTTGITFPSTRGSNGQVLTSDGAGLITWSTPATPVVPLEYFSSTTAGSIYTTGSTAFIGGESGVDSPSDKGSDVFFYVSGSTDMSAASNALFGGSVIVSGGLGVESDVVLGLSISNTIAFNGGAISDLLPADDMLYNLGSPSNRWANVYTGDLHLRNDRGNWTVIEEDDYLSIRNNKTGKMFKFVLEPV